MQKFPAKVSIVLDTTTSQSKTKVTGTITYADGTTNTYIANVDNGTPMDVILNDLQDYVRSANQHHVGDLPSTLVIEFGGPRQRSKDASIENDGSVAAIPTTEGTVYLTKAGVHSATLADPTAGVDDDKDMIIMDMGGHAHTVTNSPTGFNAGGSGSDVATFDGTKGSSIYLRAYKGVWYIRAVKGVTVA